MIMNSSLPLRGALLLSAAGTSMAIAMLMPVEQVQAEDCVLDVDGDGNKAYETGDADTRAVDSALACGGRAVASPFSTAIGPRATAGRFNDEEFGPTFETVAVGFSATAIRDRSVAIGSNSLGSGENSIAIGYLATSNGTNSLALGPNSVANAEDSIALGSASVADESGTVSVGHATLKRRITNVEAGQSDNDAATVGQLDIVEGQVGSNTSNIATLRSDVDGLDLSALEFVGINSSGLAASAGGTEAIAIGSASEASNSGSVAIGGGGEVLANVGNTTSYQTKAIGIASVAIGLGAQVGGRGLGGVALGFEANAAESRSLALGTSALATASNAVALGAHSVADAQDTVSVGNATLKRRITNVADGINDSDAATKGYVDGEVATNAANITANTTNIAALRSDVDNLDLSGSDYVAVNPYTSFDVSASATGEAAIAIGNASEASQDGAIALGNAAKSQGIEAVAIGQTAEATGSSAIAIGRSARAWNTSATAIGQGARATALNAVALGTNSFASEANTVSVGSASVKRRIVNVADPRASSDAATMAYVDTQVAGVSGGSPFVKIDDGTGQLTISNIIGYDPANPDGMEYDNGDPALGYRAIAIGHSAMASNGEADNGDALAIGTSASASGDDAIAIGTSASASTFTALAIGFEAQASALNSVALGANSVADVRDTISVGSATLKRRIVNVEAGTGANDAATKGQLDAAIAGVSGGSNPFLKVDDGTGLIDGRDPATPFDNGIANQGYRSVAIGHSTTAAGSEAIAFGSSASASANYALAMGFEAQASALNSVALGANSVADAANTVSVGSSTLKRRITNVADPTELSDAATMAYVDTKVAGVTGGGSNVPVGTVVNPDSLAIGEYSRAYQFAVALGPNARANGIASTGLGVAAKAYGHFTVAVGAHAEATASNANAFGYSANASANYALAMGFEAQASALNSVALGANSVADAANTVSVGSSTLRRRIVNVADPTELSDAATMAYVDIQIARVSGGSPFVKIDDGMGQLTRSTSRDYDPTLPDGMEYDNGDPALGYRAIAIGHSARASNGKAANESALAIGTSASAGARDAVAIGTSASASAGSALAIGPRSSASGASAVAVGGVASESNTVAIGSGAQANAWDATAVGTGAIANGWSAIAIGDEANANGLFDMALGYRATASGEFSMAIGGDATANGEYAIAMGHLAKTNDDHAIAVGTSAEASGRRAFALGPQAQANFDYALAIGYQAIATRANQFMFGTASNTYTMPGLPTIASNNAQSGDLYYVTVDADGNLGFKETPLAGQGAGSAPSGDPNQPADPEPPQDGPNGGRGNPRSSAPETPGALAQSSTSEPQITQTSVDGGAGGAPGEGVATADASREFASGAAEGDLAMSEESQNIAEPPAQRDPNAGTRRTASTSSRSNQAALRSSQVPDVSMVSQAEFDTLAGRVTSIEGRISGLEGRVSGLEGQVNSLFDLADTIDQNAKRGIAAIAAQANPHFPSEPGKTSYASNVATYRGEVGISAGLMHRFDGDFAITAGVTYAGGNSTAVRAGIAGEF